MILKRLSYRCIIEGLLVFFILLQVNSCHKEMKNPLKDSSKVVFLSNRDSPKRHFDIFIMNMDGSQQTNLTSGRVDVRSISSPQISPDGSEILFIAFDGLKKQLMKMKVDGTQVTKLTEIKTDVPKARYSPNGDKIVFADKIKSHHQINIMNSDGSKRQNLSQNNADEKEPVFSPNGKKIACLSKQTSTYSIAIMNNDGSNKKRLTEDAANDQQPQFSPDGSHIVFSSFREGDNDIYIIKQSGGKIKKLFDNKAHDTEPKYSPDGKKISFLSNIRGIRYRDVLVFDLSSGKLINLTNQYNFINQNQSFSADGQTIIFESIEFGNSEICAVNITGENLRNLTNHPKWDCAPAF